MTRRWQLAATAASIGLMACSGATGQPSTPPGEVAFIGGASGAHQVVSVRTGQVLADLPAGALAYRLSAGGDIAEAYLVSGGTVNRIDPAQQFGLQPVAQAAVPGGMVPQAVLVAAPELVQFVGARTVLVTLLADGRLRGYQSGNEFWKVDHPVLDGLAVSGLVGEGDRVLVTNSNHEWGSVAPESGHITVLTVEQCEPGPMVALTDATVFQCGSTARLVPALIGTDALLAGAGAGWGLPTTEHGAWLAWSDGTLDKLDSKGGWIDRGAASAFTHRPVLTPDGAAILMPTRKGVSRFDLATRKPADYLSEGRLDSIALSRDGNFLYTLGQNQLEVWKTGDSPEKLTANQVLGTNIELVAGG